MSVAKDYMESFRDMFDYQGAADLGRRQFEAMTAANQMLVESAQEISRRQAELAQSSLQDVIEASREMISSGTPEAGMAKQAELSKHLFENGVENVREVTEMVTKSGFEAFDLFNQSAAESMSSFQKKAKK